MTRELKELRIERLHASQISRNTWNPNVQDRGDFELLIRSMCEDGFTSPILVQRDGLQIIDGEHRWTGMIAKAFLEKYWPLPERRGVLWPAALIEEVRKKRLEILAGPVVIETEGYAGTYEGVDPVIPIVPVDFTAEQMRISTLRHNRARGTENLDKFGAVLADLEQVGAGDWARSALQVGDDEWEKLVAATAPTAAEALAGEEFGQAWEPDVVGDEADQVTEQAVELSGSLSTPLTIAASKRATVVLRERKAAIDAATTAEGRREAGKAHAVFKVSALFSAEDAVVVRQVLGDKPAERLVELCRARAQEVTA